MMEKLIFYINLLLNVACESRLAQLALEFFQTHLLLWRFSVSIWTFSLILSHPEALP